MVNPVQVTHDEDKGFTVVDRRLDLDSDAPESPETKPKYVEELERLLDAERRKVAEIKTQYKAALDEFDNASARSGRNAALEIRKGRKGVLVEMVEVLDNLDRAIEAAQGEGSPDALLSGIQLVREQFLSKLEHMGARRMSSLSQPFDPALHQAISTVPVKDPAQDGLIVGVISEGYFFEDELLRPASVAVGRKP